eukprot:CAMPEP_0184975594 /NCGR_PEP_ID=MMETSP1098-20130426/6808_1 /TAXON_ID=89044 /ORGANISM="Spumella elongata, Strain CCAP 955/1" /LENGTH=832 /DNA_ID=CAMNT_0027498353 /DNA_START=285 /DNA_END=2783 /DNA_ORIENTATION=+
MADVAISIGFRETVDSIIPLIEALSKDTEPVVKQHLVEQLRHLAKFCKEAGGKEGYDVLLEKILPVTAALLEDDKLEVRQSASLTLVEVAQLITLDDIGQYVLTIILRLAHEDDKEEMRMTASQLLNLLAESLGQDLCKQFVIPEVVSLAEDPVFRVRKSTALNLHNICKVGGEHELLERLMPAFVRLSKDDMYRVRRACAESLADIARNVSEDIRLGVLVEIFTRLTDDPSKLVKQSILQQSGVFIATLPARAVTDTILGQYCSMITSPTGDVSVDNELKQICAFSFPAVLSVVGAKKWPDIRNVYHSLAQSRNANIKKTLAYSLHEVARLLGEGSLVEEELVPVFEEMIQDAEVVQMGVIKHLAKFLAMLPELCRVSYLPLLHDILHSTNPFNWRLRQHLAYQLPQLVLLPPKQDLYRTLFSTVMILLQDPVASVRRVTFPGVTALINNLMALADAEATENGADSALAVTYRSHVDDVINSINSFATGEKYQLRQLWCELCAQLLRDLPRAFFEKNFIDGILTLTCDTVTNVRIALSEFLTAWGSDFLPPHIDPADAVADENGVKKEASPWHWLLRRADIKLCVERLARDDNDIYLNFLKLAPLYPDIKFSSFSCRGRKTPPGGLTPVATDGSAMVINYTAPVAAAVGDATASDAGASDASEVSFEDLHSDKLRSNSRDEHNRSLSSIDIGVPGANRSRSNSFNISPIEIDVISATRAHSTSFVPPLDKDFIHLPANSIVADEVDMILGFAGVSPDEEDAFAVHSTQAAGYDDDEDEEEAVAEELKLQVEREAAAAAALQAEESGAPDSESSNAESTNKEDETRVAEAES